MGHYKLDWQAQAVELLKSNTIRCGDDYIHFIVKKSEDPNSKETYWFAMEYLTSNSLYHGTMIKKSHDFLEVIQACYHRVKKLKRKNKCNTISVQNAIINGQAQVIL